ncbi:MAG TPA: hypothetical protein VIY90_18695 [Steroidobacteraceae bacterium]
MEVLKVNVSCEGAIPFSTQSMIAPAQSICPGIAPTPVGRYQEEAGANGGSVTPRLSINFVKMALLRA